jgi:metallo-beta-lactamase family protein
MEIHFLGAARTVTGSMHIVRTGKATILLDCGLFQGPRREANERNRTLPFDPAELDAVVLSHAHIDHSGLLPMMCRDGFPGNVYATPATRDLCAVMLEDAAMIQAQDARHINQMIERGELDSEPVEPLYTTEDVAKVLGRMVSAPYHRPIPIAEGVTLTFYDAGHVLGSAIVVIDVEEASGKKRRLVFSGDLGRSHMPILRDPEVPEGANVLLLESTYGDRIHPPREAMDDALAEVVTRTIKRGGKVLVPTFALERAQEVVLSLKGLWEQNRIPHVPVYVDSPLTVKVTEVFRMHPDCYDSEARAIFDRGDSPFDLPGLEYISTPEKSMELVASDTPAIILAASGMCESGRVVHHLRALIGSAVNTVVIVGFQAPHTLGRRLVEKRSRVRVFGVERDRHCEVVVLNGFSAHAGQDELVAFGKAVAEKGALEAVALVHGEPPGQKTLASLLTEAGLPAPAIPAQGELLRLP